jgi:protein Tex
VVKVRVKEVDVARKRIGLTMRSGAIDRTAASGNDQASGQGFGPRTSAQGLESAFVAALRRAQERR